MARFNTQPITGSITAGGTVTGLTQNAFTELTGTAPYTVTLPSPLLFPGYNQTFYNATSGTITLSTPAGNFTGAGGSGTSTVIVPTSSTINIVSDGANYVVVGEDGTSLTATTGSFSGNVTINGASATLSVTPQTVTIAPGGTSTIDNVNIGGTTKGSGAFNTLTANNAVTFTAGTASSSTTTGSLVVTGGIGASGNVYVGGTVSANALSGPLTGTIQTAAQPNITSLGNLTALNVTYTGGSLYTSTAGGIPRLYIGGGNGFGFNRQTTTEDIFFNEPGDTGTFRIRGAGTISLGVGNTATSMTIGGNGGNVGIGITNPQSALTVVNSGYNQAGTFYSVGDFVNNSSYSLGTMIGYDSSNGAVIASNGVSKPIAFWQYQSSAYTEIARFDSAGNLIPATTNTYTLGSSTKAWNNYYGTVDNTVNINTNSSVNRPTLVADFTTGTFDHRIFFLRNSIGTYTGPDGFIKTAPINTPRIDWDPITRECKGLLIEETRTNYRTFSDRMDQGVYSPSSIQAVIPNAALAPDGTWSATNIVENTSNARHEISMQQSVTNGTTYTYSVYAKAAGRNYIALAYSGYPISNFNLSNGTVVGSSGTITPVIQSVGNGWYRCAITFTASSTTTVSIYHCIVSISTIGVDTYTGNGTSGLYIWGGQFEIANYMTSYIPTTTVAGGRNSTGTYYDASGQLRTAAAGVNRYGYNYDVNTNKWYPIGNIIEPQATNLITSSNLYADSFGAEAIWTKTSSSTDVIAPDGTNTTTKAVSGTTGNSYFWRYSSATYTLNSTYTTSFWCRTATGTTGTFGITAYPYNQTIATVTSTWTRFSITYTVTSGTTPYVGVVGPSLNTTFYFWGWQVELGVFPTSYIPTTSATVTRAADSASSTATTRLVDNARYTNNNLTSWYNQSASTLYVEHDVIGLSNNASVGHDVFCFSKVVSGLNFGSETGAVAIGYNNTTAPGLSLAVSGVGGTNMLSTTPLNTRNRTAVAWASGVNTLYGSSNGGITTLNVTIPTYQYILTLGNSPDVAGRVLNGHIYKLIYYPTQLTNSELQELAG
jgi:hypothetical protein